VPSTRRLIVLPLTWPHCEALAPKVTPADAKECTRSGQTVLQALAAGLFLGGKAFAVVPEGHEDAPVGAFGFTCWHTVWSLWSKLTPRQSAQVLRETPYWVKGMAVRAKPHTLWNYADPDNTTAIKWLKASGAFHVDDHETFVANIGSSVYFETKAVRHV
jgi:hypothetical protein